MTHPRKYGELVDELDMGSLTVVVRYSCIRRDVYELLSKEPLSAALQQRLSRQGTMKGSDALYVVEVEGVHQITVAAAAGRVVVMPRIDTERPDQRAAVVALAKLIVSTMHEIEK